MTFREGRSLVVRALCGLVFLGCTASPSDSSQGLAIGPVSVDDLREVVVAGELIGVGPCTRTYVDGRVVSAESCGYSAAECCGSGDYDEDPDSCVLSCSCDYSEERTREVVDAEYEYRIRGVPVLFQFDTQPWEEDDYPIGCGSIAVSSLMLWYHGRGWSDLAADYETGSGLIDWETMAEEMAGTLDTWVRRNASPTMPVDMQPGIEDYIGSVGYSANVTHYDFQEEDDDEMFEHIKSSILSGRPVIMGYDSELKDGGLGSSLSDDWGWIDHYALIVGFDDTTSPPTIYVNKGWGASADGTEEDTAYDWTIGDGNVHLWFVQFDASEKSTSDEQCPADEWSTMFSDLEIDGDYIGVTEIDAAYDSYPVYSRLIRGATCDVIGGEVTHEEEYTYEWTETTSCSGLYDYYDNPVDVELEIEDDVGILDRLDP